MQRKKNIIRVGLPTVTITALLLEGATFNQDLKQEYGILPDPPQIQVVGPNPIIEEATGASGLSGIKIDAGSTGMLGGGYYGSEYYGGSDKTK